MDWPRNALKKSPDVIHFWEKNMLRFHFQVNGIGEKSKGKTQEGANNPVTDGDMLSHKAMYHGLRKAFPEVRSSLL